jgi:hypothetical protein
MSIKKADRLSIVNTILKKSKLVFSSITTLWAINPSKKIKDKNIPNAELIIAAV